MQVRGSFDFAISINFFWNFSIDVNGDIAKHRGVKFPNKLLALMSQIFLRNAVNQKSTTQIVKTFTRPA